jgi:hypothetical protein
MTTRKICNPNFLIRLHNVSIEMKMYLEKARNVQTVTLVYSVAVEPELNYENEGNYYIIFLLYFFISSLVSMDIMYCPLDLCLLLQFLH